MELGSEGHGVDDQEVVVGELEQDDLEEVAGLVGSDDEDLRWISVRFEVHDDERMVDGVADVDFGCAVSER